jgi:hypothetical protein
VTALALLAGLGLVASCGALALASNLAEAPWSFLLLYTAAFGGYALGVGLLAEARDRRAVLVVVAVAAGARAALLPAAPTLSTDAYRYVWDARVAQAGISPYVHAPTAPELAHLRDEAIYPRLNHPTWRTVYPPGAQAIFRAVYALAPDSVMAMKGALAVAELLALAAVLGLLARLGLPPGRIVIYAWNPLVLIEVWGTAHLDAVILLFVVATAWAAVADRRALAAALLGAGALVKLYPAALLPLLLVGGVRGSLPVLAAFAAVVGAGYAPAALLGVQALGSLPQYVGEEYFNPGLVRSLVDAPELALAAGALWVARCAVRRRDQPLVEGAVPLIGGVLLLGPNIFPWYAVWLVPFLSLTPSAPWIAFTGTVAFAYAFFLGDPWTIPWWARAIEFSPLALGAAWWLGRRPWLALPERVT